jgi:membrane protease YdiL (CAAX protease family)
MITVILLVVQIVIVLLLHFVIGKYPEPLPPSENRRRENIETLVMWVLAFAVVTIFIMTLSAEARAEPTSGLIVQRILVGIPFELVGPLLFVVLVKKWTARDLGFSWPRSPAVVILAVALFGFAGLMPIIGEEVMPEPLPVPFVLLALYQPAFIEEFLFRGIFQGKLERALGPTKGWFYSGIIFGLFHLYVDFFGPQWNGSVVDALFTLAGQIVAGWMFGIIYTKSRSLLPGMVAHYLTDFRLGSIVLHLFF